MTGSTSDEQGGSERSEEFLESLPNPALTIDNEGAIVRINQAWLNLASDNDLWLHRYRRGIDYIQAARSACGGRTRQGHEAADGLREVIDRERDIYSLKYSCTYSGQQRWFRMKATPFRQGGLIIHQDITGLELERQWSKALFKNSTSAIALLDEKGRVKDINDRFRECFGYSLALIRGQKLDDVLEKGRAGSVNREKTKKALQNRKFEFEGRRYDREGRPREYLIKGVPVDLNGEVKGIYAIFDDITDKKNQRRRLKYISYHDVLTGLYNRKFMKEQIKRLDTERQLPLSLIMLDINGLKIINDGFGHEMGDKLLVRAAEIMSNSIRGEDILARWAGDEFVILLPQTSREEAGRIAARIEHRCEKTYRDRCDKDLTVSPPVSLGVGVASKTKPSICIKETLKTADKRMYRDKSKNGMTAKKEMLNCLLQRLFRRSYESEEHSCRVAGLAIRLGAKLKLSDDIIEDLATLGRLHDIGKLAVSEEIIKKQDELNEREWQAIKKHAEKGAQLVAPVREYAHLSPSIESHHEHWNGRGYPRGKRGEEIPLLARIIALCDAYDVMISGRPHQKALSPEEALQEIERCAGEQFDPELARRFVKMLKYDRRREGR